MMERTEDVYIDEKHNPLMQVLKLRAYRIAILGKPTAEQEKASREIDKMLDQYEARIKELESNEQVLNDAHCKLMDKLEEKDARIKELEADYEAVMHAALVHSDENDKLNKELEDAENTYYVTKGQLDLANERIKELETELKKSRKS